jgi:predicted permease
VQPGYFSAMKIPMLRGRDFTAHDATGTTPVVIVNEALAKRHWLGEDPIGRRIRLSDQTWMTIVGVVKNVKQNDWTANPWSEIYLPHAQSTAAQSSYMTVVMRAHGDPLTLARGAEDAVHTIDKDVSVAHVMTMEQVIGDKLWRGRLAMMLLMLFAGIAITLAALGIYGAISYSVAQRTNEIGIRMALGARRMDVLQMVLRQALAVVASGISIGLFGAWMLTRALGGLLYGVTATDPVTFLAVPLLVVGLSAVACSLPALRAARVDPVTALRYE